MNATMNQEISDTCGLLKSLYRRWHCPGISAGQRDAPERQIRCREGGLQRGSHLEPCEVRDACSWVPGAGFEVSVWVCTVIRQLRPCRTLLLPLW
jgi:hypothetical protein